MGPTAADLHELDGADGGAPPADAARRASSAGLLGELAAASEVPFPGLASAEEAAPPGDPAGHDPAGHDAADHDPAAPGGVLHGPTALDPGDSPRGDLAGLADLLRAARDAATERAAADGGAAVDGTSGAERSPASAAALFASLAGRDLADRSMGTEPGGADVDGAGEEPTGPAADAAAAGDAGDGDWTVLPADLDLVVSSGRRSPWAAVTRSRPLRPRRTGRAAPHRDAVLADADVTLAADPPEPGAVPAVATTSTRRTLPVSRPVAAVVVVALLLAAGLVGLRVAGGSAPAASSTPTGHSTATHHATSAPTTSTPASTPLKSSIPKSAILPPGTHPVVANPTGSSGTPGSGGTGLTQAQAATVVSSLLPRRAAALADRSPSELAAVDTGAALQGDEALALGSGTEATVDAAHPQVTVVAGQGFPLVAEAAMPGTASGTAVDELVFVTEAGAGQPWMVSLVVDVPTAQGNQAPSAGAGALGSSTLDALAASWQQWAASGAAPTGGAVAFTTGGAYTSVGAATANQVALSAMQGIHEGVTFQAEPNTLVQMPGKGPLCGAVLQTAVFTGASGGTMTQPTDRSTWGATVAPGQYVSITEQSVAQVCMAPVVGGVQVMGGTAGRFDVSAS